MSTPSAKFVKLEMAWSPRAQPARPAIRIAPRRTSTGGSAMPRFRRGSRRAAVGVTCATVGDGPAVHVDERRVARLGGVAALVRGPGGRAHRRHLGRVLARPADTVGEGRGVAGR